MQTALVVLTCYRRCDISQPVKFNINLQQSILPWNIFHFGGLCVPSDELVSFLTYCEDIFIKNFMVMMHTSELCMKLVTAVDGIKFPSFVEGKCSGNLRVIVKTFVRMRTYYAVKFFNETLQDQSRNKRNRKVLKLQHLWLVSNVSDKQVIHSM